MTTLHTVSFKRTVLATLIGLFLSRYSFALQEISDDALSQATGEGIAILPTAYSFVLRGDKTGNEASLTDRSKDTGYIHYIPIGGLTSIVQDTNKDGLVNSSDHSVGKADLYLYGLALSKNDNDPNNRFGSKISSWGTANNPWIFKAATANNVPDFAGGNGTITYLNFEAPLYETGTKTGVDAYNLKLALWADAFVRDQSKVEGDVDQFNLGENFSTTATGRANRLRLQAIANGFSMNGSNLQVFQTLGGSNNNNGMSSFYNNTLGIAGVIRLNSGDAQDLKATVTENVSESMGTPSAWTLVHAGANSTLSSSSTGNCGNTGSTTTTMSNAIGCQYQIQTRTRTDTKTRTRTWEVPSTLEGKVLRLSTRETTDTERLTTPALDGGGAPSFDANEGLFIYNPNINLVLGSLYQPVILGSDGKNLSLEIARIPNKPEIYKKIYTDYTGADKSYLGSTCNVYQCGTSEISGYQGGSPRTDYSAATLVNKKLATHSSISIGSVFSPDSGKTLIAYSGEGALGISFGKLVTSTATNTTTAQLTEAQYKQRQQLVNNNAYQYAFQRRSYGCGFGGWSTCYENNIDIKGTSTQWQYWNGSAWMTQDILTNTNGLPINAVTCTGNTTCGPNYSTPNQQYTYGTMTNRNWATSDAVWQTGSNASVNAILGATAAPFPATNQAATPAIITNASPSNNLGSAVIDGLLIQHFKVTTTGL